MSIAAPTLAEIQETAARLQPYLVRTPTHIWNTPTLDAVFGKGTEVVAKLELFQHTGSFKVRGALNNALSLSEDQRRRGITTVSAGNHAIAAAYAARSVGTSAKVVMQRSANPARVSAARAFGAEILFAADGREAFALAERIVQEEGRAMIHPFEGPGVALGTGTIGLEIDAAAGALDALVIPIGGGGLCAGVATAIKLRQPACRIFGVEPDGADVMRQSLAAGHEMQVERVSTIADSLAPPMTRPYSFALCQRALERVVTVDDTALCRAMALLFSEMKLAVEPAGAAATAALLGPLRDELKGKRVGLIVCGANIDIDNFNTFIRRGVESAAS